MKGGWFRIAVGSLAVAAMLTIGCAHAPKVQYEKVRAFPTVIVKGYGWGENAEENALKAARLEAALLAKPRAIEFTYLRVGPYSMFKTDQMDQIETQTLGTRPLPDGGVEATVQAARSKETLRLMDYMTAASFEMECEGATFRQRIEKCENLVLERAMTIFAGKSFGVVPEKLKGNYTFFKMDREDDGKDTLTVKVSVFVGFLGRGKLTPDEKGMVLMNAWRNACAMGAGTRATPIYKQAIAVFPNAAFSKEYAMYEISEKRIDNAISAINDAIRINPHDLDNYKILYQLYKMKNDETRMAEVAQKLKELEAWEDNPGADLTRTLQFSEKVRWTEGGDEKTPSGAIYFREVDEAEQKQLEGKDE